MMVSTTTASEEITYIKHSLQKNKWFIKSLQNRKETLLKVASCIVNKQINFFELG